MTIASTRRRGFTLIEMVLVLIILATIAGLVISQIGFLGRTADMAATAKTQQDVANQLSLYFILQKRMPQRLDSLLISDGVAAPSGVLVAVDAAGTTTSDANLQRWGLPRSGANSTWVGGQLAVTDLGGISADTARSFTRLGFDAVMDHVAITDANTTSSTAGISLNCNRSGFYPRPLTGTGVTCWAATVNDVAVPGGIRRTLYPHLAGALPTGVTALVAVGVGPRSSLVPDTMLNAPIYPGCDGSYYGHYIAYFACFATGERAQLVGVSDSYGRFPNYSIQQFNESLPNNGRQG